ncbi:MAG: sugar phosphate isomerase/epimerase [Eubacteriales bacterium]|nr:sugar phosphate isomerase/epimerase [Eubacteriales bacterium]
MEKIKSIGLQLYTIRDHMGTSGEVRDAFARIMEMGYTEAQTAGCKIPYEEFGKYAEEAGIRIVGTHDSLDMMINDLPQSIKNHRALGTTNMGIGGAMGMMKSEEGVMEFIKLANKIADEVYKEGFKFTYHNHSAEFMKYNGKRVMDMLVEGMDPVKTSFVLDTYWVQHGGGDVRAWIEKLSGRIDILHLKDMGRDGTGPYITEIGNGNMDFGSIIESAQKSGVKYYVVEQDRCPGDSFDSARMSSEYIRSRYM